ncbi:hypothetical protein SprV_0301120000 [Sparganum proliferum]
MSPRLLLRGGKFTTIISAYIRTMAGSEEAGTNFYEELHIRLPSVPKAGKLIVLDDFNVCVGTDHAAWRGVLDPHGITGCNGNDPVLLQTCAKHRLQLTNTSLRLSMRKVTWIHPAIAVPAAAGLCFCSAAGSTGDLRRRWPDGPLLRHLRDEVLSAIPHEATSNMLTKNRPHGAYLDRPTDTNKAAFYQSRRLAKERLREMQDSWVVRKTEEIQAYAVHHNSKNFFASIKAIYGPPTERTAPFLSSDRSTLLRERSQIQKRWTRHFGNVLNHPSAISDAAIDRLPQVEINVDLDLPPCFPETIRAVQELSSGKASGSNAIPVEIYKHGGHSLMDQLTTIFQHLEQGLQLESQCGFRRHRGTTDILFVARQLQMKCQEMRTHFYTTFVDLTKAFDTVNREGLWKIMRKFGCPDRLTHMVRQLYNVMMALVMDTEAFAVTNGVKQGCVLAPISFSLMLFAMPMDAYRDERPRIRIAHRTDGHIFNSRRMMARTRLSTPTVYDLPFADDCELNSTIEMDMQRSMDVLAAGCANFGLTINAGKTLVMHQPSPNTQHCPPPRITVDGYQLKIVDKVTYLGSTLCNSSRIDDEISRRISKAIQAFDRLNQPGR